MALIDRVKERTETDLSDEEIQAIIDEAVADITARHGPSVDPEVSITDLREGLREVIVVDRAIDTSQTIVVQEEWDAGPSGIQRITLGANDYRIWPDNCALQRRQDGVGSNPRRIWGDRVYLTYVPVSDQKQRDEVTVKLAIIAIQFDAFASQTVGDVSLEMQTYQDQRNSLINSIAPRHGIYMQ